MLKRAEPRLHLGLLFFAVLFSDFLLGVFYWTGQEQAYIPADFARLHYISFSFPYSHGLLASLLWSVLAFLLARYYWRNRDGAKIGIILGLAVFSHFILDFIVHVPELPVLGRESVKLGLGLWNHMAVALTVEMVLVVVGLVLYLPVAKQYGASGRIGVLILMVAFSVLTVAGMTSSTPPDVTTVAMSWIAAPLALSGIAFWLDQPARQSK